MSGNNNRASEDNTQGQMTQGGYESMSSGQPNMGGGVGTHGSGVAGGYEGNTQSQSQAAKGEKQDWLDKGIESIGKKFGVNVSDQNADKAGDLANKQFNQRAGRGLPGVQ